MGHGHGQGMGMGMGKAQGQRMGTDMETLDSPSFPGGGEWSERCGSASIGAV